MNKKHGAKPAPKKKDNTLLYGLGVLILIVIIVLIVRSGGDEAGSADIGTGDQTPTQTPQKPVTDDRLQGVLEEFKCDVNSAIGFRACNALANGDVEVVVLHSTPANAEPIALTGAQYYLFDENGEKVAEASQMGRVESGAEATYTLPVSQYAEAMKVEIRPVINVDGIDKICVNQRVIVIPANSCK